jgi:Zn-dependent protease
MSAPADNSGPSNWPLLALVLAWIVGDGSTLQSFQGLPDGALGNAVFIFGAGVSIAAHEFVGRGRRRRSEIAAAAFGLVSNLVVAAAMLAAARIVYLAPGPDAVVGALAALVTFNIVLTATNLLPALPLDGGRIVSALASRNDALAPASNRLTAACTEATGWLFLVFGLGSAVADGPTAGIAWLLISAVILQDARSERCKLTPVRGETRADAGTSPAAGTGVRAAQG